METGRAIPMTSSVSKTQDIEFHMTHHDEDWLTGANGIASPARGCPETLQRELERAAGRKLKMRINDNRSTMLSVRWDREHTRVSIHRMFLKAPKNVMDELACYLSTPHQTLSPTVKAFIEDSRRELDYSHCLRPSDLAHQGHAYDLHTLYDEVNARYFDQELQLQITWFSQPARRNRQRLVFGLFHDTLRLIKINRLLDNLQIPRYFVSYVIYHEMLHFVCPPEVDQAGCHRIHNTTFKQRESLFAEYQEAQEWLKQNKQWLFDHTSTRGKNCNGWT